MSQHYSISLPVKPYIRKYVAKIEGDPIEFYGKNLLCTMFRAFLQNSNKCGFSRDNMDLYIRKREDEIKIMVPVKRMAAIGHSLDPHGVILLNQFLEQAFKRDLLDFMKKYTAKEGRYKGIQDGHYAFAEAYGIEIGEDISYDCLRKMDGRLRKENAQKGKKNFLKFVPSL